MAPALASDDVQWIALCIQDNDDADVTAEVVANYCACMNEQMDEGETLTVTQWEEKHPDVGEACSKAVGWD